VGALVKAPSGPAPGSTVAVRVASLPGSEVGSVVLGSRWASRLDVRSIGETFDVWQTPSLASETFESGWAVLDEEDFESAWT